MLPRIRPMKATAGALPSMPGWAYEVKWDGMRIVAYVNDDRARLRLETVNGKSAEQRFPELHGLAAQLGSVRAVLDGEVVALAEGRPSFGHLQQRMHLTQPVEVSRMAAEVPISYVVFDLLHLEGHSTLTLPYRERRRLLTELLAEGDSWQVPAHHEGDGAAVLAGVAAQGLEGLVAKHLDSPYLPGRRSSQWVKVKVRHRQELVIGGWQPGEGRRETTLGSLLVGYHEPEAAGRPLRYAGKVGTGFDERELGRLHGLLAELATPTPPFNPPPPAAVARSARWVQPELVCEVDFGEWTGDGVLRHASYLGLRTDKAPSEVVRESLS